MVDRRVALQAARAMLGVAADADAGKVTRAYRLQARRLHPDVNSEADAATRFLALQAAYRLSLEALRDPAEVGSGPTPRERTTPAEVFVAEPVAAAAGQVDLWSRAGAHGAWLVVGPVHVHPPRTPYPTTKVHGGRR